MKKFMRYYLTVLMMLSLVNSTVFASGGTSQAYQDISKSIAPILNAAAWFGYAIALGMFLYIGAKYTLSAASEKANVKQGLINYLIGAILIASASLIADIASGIATGGTASGAAGLADQIIDAGKNAAGIN